MATSKIDLNLNFDWLRLFPKGKSGQCRDFGCPRVSEKSVQIFSKSIPRTETIPEPKKWNIEKRVSLLDYKIRQVLPSKKKIAFLGFLAVVFLTAAIAIPMILSYFPGMLTLITFLSLFSFFLAWGMITEWQNRRESTIEKTDLDRDLLTLRHLCITYKDAINQEIAIKPVIAEQEIEDNFQEKPEDDDLMNARKEFKELENFFTRNCQDS